MRTKVPAVAAVVAASVLVLAGCSASPSPAGSSSATPQARECADTPSGGAADKVAVSGDLGSQPTVTFDAGITTDETVRDISLVGTGAEVGANDLVQFEVTIYNGATGELVSQTSYAGGAPTIDLGKSGFIPGLVRTLECTTAGSRVVSVVSGADAFGEKGSADGKVTANQPLVVVADVLRSVPQSADGVAQTAVEGYPTVALDDTGTPTITLPATEPPTELKLAILKQGSGEKVQPGDTVTVQYQGVNWRTGEVFDQSWGKAPAQFATDGVVPGFKKALEGYEVGSQVLAILPPAEGYGEQGSAGAGIEGTDTLVFVVDILATSR